MKCDGRPEEQYDDHLQVMREESESHSAESVQCKEDCALDRVYIAECVASPLLFCLNCLNVTCLMLSMFINHNCEGLAVTPKGVMRPAKKSQSVSESGASCCLAPA